MVKGGEEQEDLASLNARFESATPAARLQYAVEAFGKDLLFTSSFGSQSIVLLHLWSRVAKDLPVIFIDTGFLFPETIRYKDEIRERLGLTITTLRPDIENQEFVARYGTDIQARDADFCCSVNKVAPLASLRAAAKGWVSGLRRDQSKSRADVAIFEREEENTNTNTSTRVVRVHPLATLTRGEITDYITAHDLPEHPLVKRRYLSIGCAPCTRTVDDGDLDERAGRWAWSQKTECGLHKR
jgi:phosphoadenosine phosphosulfate reductase